MIIKNTVHKKKRKIIANSILLLFVTSLFLVTIRAEWKEEKKKKVKGTHSLHDNPISIDFRQEARSNRNIKQFISPKLKWENVRGYSKKLEAFSSRSWMMGDNQKWNLE